MLFVQGKTVIPPKKPSLLSFRLDYTYPFETVGTDYAEPMFHKFTTGRNVEMKKCYLLSITFTSTRSTGASGRSFYPIFNKKFDHLETLLTIHRPKKVLSAGSLCGPLVPSPQCKCPKGASYYPKSIMLQLHICYHSHLNV